MGDPADEDLVRERVMSYLRDRRRRLWLTCATVETTEVSAMGDESSRYQYLLRRVGDEWLLADRRVWGVPTGQWARHQF